MKRKLFALFEFMRRNFWSHEWRYSNPHNRRCQVCGRHEVEHSNGEIGFTARTWWEVFDDGKEEKHYV